MSAKLKVVTRSTAAEDPEIALKISHLPKRYQDLLMELRDKLDAAGDWTRTNSMPFTYISRGELDILESCTFAMDDLKGWCTQDSGPGGTAGLVFLSLLGIYEKLTKRIKDSAEGGAQ